MSIGERISMLRKEKGISQYKMAQLLDVSRQAVSKWENDLTTPDTIKLIQLADILDSDVEFLATGKHSMRSNPPQIVTVEKVIENIVEVERVVEKPIVVEKTVEIEKIVESFVEKPVIRKVYRTRYLRNPVEYAVIGFICLIIGFFIGFFI